MEWVSPYRVGSHLFKGATVVHACLCIALYVFHATYLLFVKLDYGYNMVVNIGVGMYQKLFVKDSG